MNHHTQYNFVDNVPEEDKPKTGVENCDRVLYNVFTNLPPIELYVKKEYLYDLEKVNPLTN